STQFFQMGSSGSTPCCPSSSLIAARALLARCRTQALRCQRDLQTLQPQPPRRQEQGARRLTEDGKQGREHP
ncbi:MAG: hypothetical protein ACK55Z_13715, partial [bacterium]